MKTSRIYDSYNFIMYVQHNPLPIKESILWPLDLGDFNWLDASRYINVEHITELKMYLLG